MALWQKGPHHRKTDCILEIFGETDSGPTDSETPASLQARIGLKLPVAFARAPCVAKALHL